MRRLRMPMQRFRRRRGESPYRIGRRLSFEALEERQLLTVSHTATPDGDTLSVEFALEYDAGETVFDLEDLYLRTDSSGNLEFSTSADSGFADINADPLTSFTSVVVTVKYGAQSDEDFSQLVQNLFNETVATLHLQDIWAPGVDLSFKSLAIDVDQDQVVSTRDLAGANPDQLNDASQGDSGDLSIDAPLISVNSGAALLTDVGGAAFSAGDITVRAVGSLDDISSVLTILHSLPLAITTTQAKLDVDDATIRGRDVSITVESDASDLFDDEDEPGGFTEPIIEYVGNVSFGVGVAISHATATVTITDGEIIADDITVSTKADSDAEATVLSTYGAFAYGDSRPTARVDFKGDVLVDATGDLTVTANTSSDLGIIATQKLIGTSSTVERYNVTVAAAYSDVISAATFSSDSVVDVDGDFFVDVDAKREHLVSSTAAAYGDGTLATAINVGVHDSKLDALLDGMLPWAAT